MIRLVSLALLLALLGAVPRDARTEPAERRRHRDAKKRHSFSVPAAWKVEDGSLRLDRGQVIGMRFSLPDGEDTVELRLYHLNGMVEPLAQAHTEKPVLEKSYAGGRVEVIPLPRPHVVIEYTHEDVEMTHVHVYQLLRGNGFTFAARVRRPLWEHVREEVFKIAGTIESNVEQWPAVPKDYLVYTKHGFMYYYRNDVSKKQVESFHRVVRKRQAAFGVIHGPPEPAALANTSIVFHLRRQHAGKLSRPASEGNGYYFDTYARRLYAVPYHRKDPKCRADANYEIWSMLYRARYGSMMPDWLSTGETFVEHGEGETGRSLPYTSRWVKSLPPLSVAELVDLFDSANRADETFRQNAALYVAVLRAGPRSYRKAYRDFLEAYATHGDWAAAQDRHLASLDQAKLKKAAVAYLAKLKTRE